METSPPTPEPAIAQPGTLCPSCERFIGPTDVCPYCGADSARLPILRHLRRAALLLAVTGVVGLYLFARHSDPPVVKMGAISPAMNFAFVQVNGRVSGAAKVFREGGEVDHVSFSVNDGTGRLRVVAEGPVARTLSRNGGVPADGEWVDVTGTLNVSAEGAPRLRLYADGQVCRRPPGNDGGARN
jgi:hypothetical protein